VNTPASEFRTFWSLMETGNAISQGSLCGCEPVHNGPSVRPIWSLDLSRAGCFSVVVKMDNTKIQHNTACKKHMHHHDCVPIVPTKQRTKDKRKSSHLDYSGGHCNDKKRSKPNANLIICSSCATWITLPSLARNHSFNSRQDLVFCSVHAQSPLV
jgi:hypothetical protein